MAAFAGKEKDTEWNEFYGSKMRYTDLDNDQFIFDVAHHPYVIQYDKFIWNAANIPGTLSLCVFPLLC